MSPRRTSDAPLHARKQGNNRLSYGTNPQPARGQVPAWAEILVLFSSLSLSRAGALTQTCPFSVPFVPITPWAALLLLRALLGTPQDSLGAALTPGAVPSSPHSTHPAPLLSCLAQSRITECIYTPENKGKQWCLNQNLQEP